MKSISIHQIKSFIIDQLSQARRYVVNTYDLFITRETEKAVLIECYSKLGTVKFWCPKSCIFTQEELAAIREKELAKASIKPAWQIRYEELFNKAKALGVKGLRNKMKTETIKAKAAEQGIILD